MKHFYSQIKNFINIALFLGIFLQSYLGNSQTTLAAGDIVFSGFDATANATSAADSYSFVLLTNISANTVISFSDRGYAGGGSWASATATTEGAVTWTSGTAIAAGTEIVIKGLTASVYNPTTSTLTPNGTVVATESTLLYGLSLSSVGDQIIVFQGGGGVISGGGVTVITGLTYYTSAGCAPTVATWDVPSGTCTIGPNSSVIPPGLTGGVNAFFTGGSNPTSGVFNGTGAPFANVAAIRAALTNQSNWTLSSAATGITMPSGYNFLGVLPTITGNPANRTICPGGNTTFNVTATNATSYKWQVNTGSGFTDLTNGAPYSGVTTATLTITGATTSMNGYLYRCVVSGAGSVNSNSATLSIPNTIVTTTAQTNVSCNGGNTGSATISASGGFAPYTYSWSLSSTIVGTTATVTNLTAGTYTVTVTDNIGCQTPHTVIITEPTLAASSPSITTQPASYAACAGSTASFSVVATNTATYQWEVNTGSGYTPITNGGGSPNYSGSNTANLNISSITSVMNGYTYRVALTSSCSNTITSNGLAQLNVTALPVATATPASPTVCSGSSPNIALTSAPTGATFSWTVVTTSGTVSGASAGSGTSINQTLTGNGVVTYTVTPTLNSCPGTPITIPVTVNPSPVITAQPSGSTICTGANTTFSVTAANATGYQWQVDQGAGFSNVPNTAPYSGTTSATLTITGATAGLNGYVYRIIATGACTPNAVSNAVALTVNSAPSITAQPSASTICAGANTTFTATASGATGYQWQVDQGAGFSNIANGAPYSGATTATLTITGATTGLNGYIYRVVATGLCTPNATSNSAALTINSAPSITTQPSNSITCLGSNATFTVVAANATGYQWQVNQGAGFFNIPNIAPYSGATTATLTITGATAGMNGYVYRVVATGLCTPAATSSARTLTIPVIIAGASQTNIACNGGATGIATVTPTGGTAPYTYLWSNNETSATISGLTAGTYSVTIKDANQCEKIQSFTITEPPVLIATQGTVNNVSCYNGANGTATVNVTGGTGAGTYTYSWIPSVGSTATVTGLAAGTYEVTVTDANSCTTTQTFLITQPPAFSITPSQTNILCNGAATGSASVAVTGGTGNYSYSWSPAVSSGATASALTAGTYTVTIKDDNLCQAIQTFTITEPTALTATQGPITNISCHGDATGSATVNVTGGTSATGEYHYSWAPSGGIGATATGLTAGAYIVTITDDNSCTTTQNFNITEPAAALSATTASIPVSCFGGSNGSASVTVSGGTPLYTYQWAPLGGTTATITGRPAGDYTCTITDANGCKLIKNITIDTPAVLSATSTKTDVSCNGGVNGSATVTVTGGTGDYHYSWSPTGGAAATATGLTAGTYTVTITDDNTCSITQNIIIDQPAALAATQSQTDVLCNGSATGTATVTVTGGTPNYSYTWSPSVGNQATVTGLTAGVYNCLITDGKGCTLTKTFVIAEPAVLSATQSQINATCSTGGQAAVNVTGGSTPYTYSWTPSGATAAVATGLAAGIHSVLIEDANGCKLTKTFTIGTTNTLTAIQSQTDVLCNGSNTGSATVIPAGAPGPFTYVWSPSVGNSATVNNLTAGNYAVTITSANGCSIIKNFTITEPTALTVTPSQTNIACNGGVTGSATVNVTGGTGLYTYNWAPIGGTAATASGLAAGTYVVTIKDANLCQTTQSFTITQPAAIVATTSQTNVSCNGGSNGSATVSVTGGTGDYHYSWSPTGGGAATATGLSAGTYTVTITDDNSCTTTQNVTITEPAALSAATSKTDVSCNGANDGTASVTVTGGTGAYNYSWLPSGQTTATASGLAPGTYTVTATDANGCSINQSVSIITTPDVTAPVPNVAALPDITNYCAVLASQIPIPTATDNCVGTVNGTTTSPLNYNAVGTYTITWNYVDASGNNTTQLQTVNVIASPLNAVTFTDAQFTYDGNTHPLQVANLPTGATVTYSANNTSVNAGTYVVTATVTPSASSPNCSPVVLTANLVINKAAQQITFGAIPVKTLGANNSFNLTATSSSNLPVTYTFTYTSALPPATVTAAGAVTMLRSGQGTITAQQAGNSNYLPATDVSQLLVILNNNIDVKRITLGTKVFDNPGKTIYHLLSCGETNPNVSILNESGATITPSANFTIQTPKPGIYTQNATITSQDGSISAVYSITVEKPFGFFDIVHQKFNNVLLVNNNPQTNGGYEFVAYQWFKNGQLIGTGQYYSAGESISTTLDPTADYSVKMTTKDGKVLQTCTSKITFTKKLEAKLYPNPIQTGKVITVEADFPEEELQNMQISLYSATGQLVKVVQSSSVKTEIQLPPTTESSMYLVVLETPNVKKSFKVIVK
nr:T9SS type A sorting domain-containing protein [Flavobacterium sp. ASV13]